MLSDSDIEPKRLLTPSDDREDVVTNIHPDEPEGMEDDAELPRKPSEPRADDHQAMRDRFMPVLAEYETKEEVHYTWDIENWRQLPKKTHSPVFYCAGHPWRILCFPAGNAASESVSFYLEQGFGDEEGDKPPEDWYACAQFMLVLHNAHDPSIHVHSEANHRFTAEEGDWGFTRFAEKNRIFAARFDGADRPLVENDCAKMTAHVRVLKDPTGVLWHNFVNYDSKKETGMVGLRNQGATCYLNSLLQSLYLTGAFRKAVYQIPTATEQDRQSSVSAYALQRLFYRLQADPIAVSTAELTQSFGWESRQIFEQQDVQELSRILMEKLEARMKGTEAESALNSMFVGKMKTYLKCINVDYESSRTEEFWDLQLNVAGCNSLDASFKDYIQVETLEGDNKYAAEGYGLQDAKKGVIFQSFPKVLHLQLKRFEYDFQRDAMMKVNDRYEFPEIWDASPYLDETADKSEPNIYHLHGVLVHSGDLNAGHYYAFLKPEKNGHFYRFDDDRVTKATKREAIDDNFGGDFSDGINGAQKCQNPYTRQWSTKRSNNAYMLVYIRESRLDQILPPAEEMQPPEHLPTKVAEERALLEKRRKEREEAHLYMNVAVAYESSFKAYDGVDLLPWGRDDEEDEAAPKLHRLLRNMTIEEFRRYITIDRGVEPDLIRPWIMVNRQNGTVRPDRALTWPDMTLQEAADKFSTRNSGFRVFMEETVRDADGNPIWSNFNGEAAEQVSPPAVNGTMPAPRPRPIIVFLKYFDVDRQTLRGVGHIYMSPSDRTQDLAAPILELMGWEPGTSLELFEEIKQNYIEPMKPKQTLHMSEIQNGDIVCFQRSLSGDEITQLRETQPTVCHSAPLFYDFLMNRMIVKFSPKYVPAENLQVRNESDEMFSLAFSKKDNYDVLASKVAEYLSKINTTPIHSSHLRFTTANAQSGKPRSVVKRQSTTIMANILLGTGSYGGGHGYSSQAPDHLFYEVLEMSLTDLEQRKSVRIVWLSEGIAKEEPHDLLVHKSATFRDVAEALQKRAGLPDELMEHLRFYETHNNKFYKVLLLPQSVVTLNEFNTVYAESVPSEERAAVAARSADPDAEPDAFIVWCMHFDKEPSKAHGVPFAFLVKRGEVFKDTKERLSLRTGIKGKQFEKIRFASIKGGQGLYSQPMWLEDGKLASVLCSDAIC